MSDTDRIHELQMEVNYYKARTEDWLAFFWELQNQANDQEYIIRKLKGYLTPSQLEEFRAWQDARLTGGKVKA